MTIGEKIRHLRLKNGISQEGLAEQLDVSRQAVSKWEKGQSFPSTENLLMLAGIFQVSVEELTAPSAAAAEETQAARSTKHAEKWKWIALAAVAAAVVLGLLLWKTSSLSEEKQGTSQKSLVDLLREGEVSGTVGCNLPPAAVVQSLLHEVFQEPAPAVEVQADRLWEMAAELRFPGEEQVETVTFHCGLEAPAVVELCGRERFPESVFVESPELYELVRSARDPKMDEDQLPYIDDPAAYGRYQTAAEELLSLDFGKDGVHTHSKMTHFLAVQTGPHPLGMEVYYVGFYTLADPIERTGVLLTGDAYADSQLRIFDLEPRQSLVTVDKQPIGFVSKQWLRETKDRFDSQEELIEAVRSQGLPVSAAVSQEYPSSPKPTAGTKESPKSSNQPFPARPLEEAQTNGMQSHTYDSKLACIQGLAPEGTLGAFYCCDQFLEFTNGYVSLGNNVTSRDDGTWVPCQEAYILTYDTQAEPGDYIDSFLGRLPLPVNQDGQSVLPQSVTELENGFIAYTVDIGDQRYCYTVDPFEKTVSMQAESIKG